MKLNIISFLSAILGNHMACQIQFLQYENQILRRRITSRYVIPTQEERFELLKLGKPLGRNIKDIITIVKYDTFIRWIRYEKYPDKNVPHRKRGRKKKSPELRKIVAQMARKNKWGFTRILGELYKLGIYDFCVTTVSNILKENGIPPAPRRKETWMNSLIRHHDTLIACDFFKQWVWTLQGPRLAFALFYINIKTRKVKLAGVSKYPKPQWVLEQTEKVFQDEQFSEGGRQILIRDLDSKFTKKFDKFFRSKGYDIFHTPPRSPNLNAFAESWIGRMRNDCTNHFMIFGLNHLKHLLSEYIEYYNTKRPHMGKGLRTLSPVEQRLHGKIKTKRILGGLHHHYYRD